MSDKNNEADAYTLTDEELEGVSGGEGEYKGQGMPCPRCKWLIHIDVTELLERRIIDCPHCGLRINVDYKK